MFSCSVCTIRDPSTDTIMIAPTSIEKQDSSAKCESADPWQNSREEEEAAAVRAAEELGRKETLAAEAWMRTALGLEDAWVRDGVAEWKEAKLGEEAQAIDAARRDAEEAERVRREAQETERLRRAALEEAQRHAEAQKKAEAEADKKAQERKKKVKEFLQKYGYVSVSKGKRTLTKTTYALHEAAKRGDAEMAMMLILEGADMAQKNSKGQTALQRAQQQDNKTGSHADVVRVLGGGVAASRGGA